MQCVNCSAQTVPGASSCYFCGAPQPSRISRRNYRAPVNAPDGNDLALSRRTNASYFQAGVSAPLSSAFLLRTEQWRWDTAGKTDTPTPPINLWGNLVLLGFGAFLFSVWIGFFGLIAAPGLSGHPAERAKLYLVLLKWLPFAAFYVFSLIVARKVQGELDLLIQKITNGSPAAMAQFRRGKFRRFVASLMALSPVVLLVILSINELWERPIESQALPIVLAIFCIPLTVWSTTWLHFSPFARYREVMVKHIF